MDGIRDGIKFARFCNQGGEKSGDKNATSGKATRKTNWEMKARNTRIRVTPQIAILRIGAQTDIWKDIDETDLQHKSWQGGWEDADKETNRGACTIEATIQQRLVAALTQ